MTWTAMLAGVQTPGRFNHARLAEGEKSDENQTPGPPGWGFWHGISIPTLEKPKSSTETSNQETLQPEARDDASRSTSDEMTDVDQTGPGVHTPNVDSLTLAKN
jgi:hypothetical protein